MLQTKKKPSSRAVSTTLNSAVGWKEKGNQFFKNKEFQKAIECYQTAVEINPQFKEAWRNQALCFHKLNRNQEALESVEQALQIDPKYTNAVSLRTNILYLQKEYLKALQTIDAYYDLGGEANNNITKLRKECGSHCDKRYANYIKATQGGSVRFDQEITPESIKGLCTDGISACVAIIIINPSNTRFSLTHTPLAVSAQALVNECRWVGNPCNFHLIRGATYRIKDFEEQTDFRTKFLPKIKKAFSDNGLTVSLLIEGYTSYPGSVAISRHGRIECLPTLSASPITFFSGVDDLKFKHIGQVAPDGELRHTINMLNQNTLMFYKKEHPLDLQYDVNDWTPFPELDKPARSLIDDIRRVDVTKPIADLNDLFARYLRNRALIYLRIEAELITRTNYALSLCKKGHYHSASPRLQGFLGKAEKLWGKTTDAVAKAYYNLGLCYEKLRNESDAQTSFRKSHEIRKELFGEKDPRTQKVAIHLDSNQEVAANITPTTHCG